MAYNILKGNVEFTGDNGSLENTVRTDNANQSIDGKKTFLQRITASAITLNGSNLTAPAVTSVTNAAAGRVAMFNGAAGLSGSSVFTYAAGGVLSATIYSGSGAGLTNIRTDQFQGYISASNLVLGTGGLKSDSGTLIVSGGAGVSVTAGGATIVNTDTYGGLNFNGSALIVDTGQTYDIATNGQTLASGDKLLVQDVAGANPAAPQLRSMTVGTLTTYLNSNLTFPTVGISTLNSAGANRVITSDGGSTATANPNLTFTAGGLTVTGDITMNGANRILSGGVVRAASGAAVVGSRLAVGTQHDPAYDISVYNTASANMFMNGVSDANYLIGMGGTSYGGLQLLGAGDMKLSNTQAGKDVILEVNGGANMFRIAPSGITGSANMLLTGTAPHLFVGAEGDVNSGMITVRAKPSNNKVLILAQDTDYKPLFGVSGSGRVLVGGNYLEGRLNVSGSDSEKLLTIKTDSVNPMFHVSRSAAAGGEMYISGNIVVRNTNPTLYFSNSAGDNLGSIGYNATNNILIQNDVANKHIVFKANDAGTTREGLRLDGAIPEVVVNQSHESLVNFRVEGDTKQYLIYAQGSTDRVGIGKANPTQLFTVGGNATISGSLRAKQLDTTLHDFNNAGAGVFWIPWMTNADQGTPDYVNQFVAPATGRLVRAYVRAENGQSGSVILDVFAAADGTPDFSGASSAAERTSTTMTARDTSYAFNTTGSNHFAGGDIVGIRLTPQSAMGNVNLTCIWEYDFLGI